MATNHTAQGKPQADDADIATRIRTEIERTIQRNLNGLAYIGTPAPAVGATPRTQVARRGTFSLYHYQPVCGDVYRVPILLVMATTNKSFILDLAPGRSLMEFLVQRGYDVYVVDWNPPGQDERGLRVEDYVQDFIPEAVRHVQERSGEKQITLIGYCMGSVLTTIYSALNPGAAVKNLIGFTTPIDYTRIGFRDLNDQRYFDVDRLVDSVGIVPASMIEAGFEVLRPAGRPVSNMRLWDNLWNDDYVQSYRMLERWGAETLPLPGEYFRQLTKELFWKNGLVEGSLRIGGRPVRLSNIDASLLSVVAEHDHLVPPECAAPLVEQAGSRDKEQLVLPGGHVSLIAGPNAIKRLWPKLDQWLQERST